MSPYSFTRGQILTRSIRARPSVLFTYKVTRVSPEGSPAVCPCLSKGARVGA